MARRRRAVRVGCSGGAMRDALPVIPIDVPEVAETNVVLKELEEERRLFELGKLNTNTPPPIPIITNEKKVYHKYLCFDGKYKKWRFREEVLVMLDLLYQLRGKNTAIGYDLYEKLFSELIQIWNETFPDSGIQAFIDAFNGHYGEPYPWSHGPESNFIKDSVFTLCLSEGEFLW